jgi:hypothetical protein
VTADVLLNLAGWGIAGLVTLVGAYVLFKWQEWGRERREVYRPVHAELQVFAKEKRRIREGRDPPRFSDPFMDLLHGGQLRDERHDCLYEDVRQLITLRDAAARAVTALSDAYYDYVESLWKRAGLKDYDSQLAWYIISQNEEAWVRRFSEQLPAEWRKALGRLDASPADLYEEGRDTAAEMRAAAEQAGADLAEHVNLMQDRLDWALRRPARKYRRRPS